MASASRLTDPEPAFIYGTAWKKDRTKDLVKDSLEAGFRSIDTAAQPRHYQEALVGEGLREAYAEGIVKREDIYLQTKYTSPAGQDHENMPYHPLDPLPTQIHTSLSSSFSNLRPESAAESQDKTYLDSLLLHSPLPTLDQTLLAWKTLEPYVPDRIRALGISNVSLPVLDALYQNSTVKPKFVQNRFYPSTAYDIPLRAYCREKGITYQSFWTLTGNPELLASKPVARLASEVGVGREVALYALVMDLGVVVLNGTTTAEHMAGDLDGIRKVREWKATHEKEWEHIGAGFEKLVES
ncbi:putative aldo-keto reductase [Corynespora cassiicola Philippines]|uniref:Putative aldo-keto reductase n=1 Tax=Corynespora cassiicola Philippines TaxID=1448308 RepID=A0A2T2PD94_CORCC|nr:putative aldo-keto reductase [Corynespora cassiicola Philippines]